MRCLLPPPAVLVQAVVALSVPAQCLAAQTPTCPVPWGWAQVCRLRRALTSPAHGFRSFSSPAPLGVAEEDSDSISGSAGTGKRSL